MESKEQQRNEQMGGLAGLGAGVIAGAEIGTVAIPIPVVGSFVGAMVGGVLGSAVGQRVGGAALGGVNAFLDGLFTPHTHNSEGPHTPAGGAFALRSGARPYSAARPRKACWMRRSARRSAPSPCNTIWPVSST